ncbi:anaphase promoting complex subunit morula [Brevipalpus obovatus]|uniref:anaphase promoting complex subunit morula n=1 Tax=Brevipalpus obovatus TaxID=246614 RepID=UPI003D9DB5E3
MLSPDDAWTVLIRAPSSFGQSSESDECRIKEALHVLASNDLITVYQEWYFETFRKHFIRVILPEFWSYFKEAPKNDADMIKTSLLVFKGFKYLHYESQLWLDNQLVQSLFLNQAEALTEFQDKMKDLIKSFLLCPPSSHPFDILFLTVYKVGFKIAEYLDQPRDTSMRDDSEAGSSMMEETCTLCQGIENYKDDSIFTSTTDLDVSDSRIFASCNCVLIKKLFLEMNRHLRDLNLLKEISTDAVLSVMHHLIENYVHEKCKSTFDESFLDKLELWIHHSVSRWRTIVFGEDSELFAQASSERLQHLIYEVYANLRISQFFDIIVEYPDAEPALIDLRECLAKCHDLKGQLIKSIKNAFDHRLLYPAVPTNDILTAYIQTIKSLKILDDSGVILEKVCVSIKKYLKGRDDTVKCIITALTDESSELAAELAKDIPPTDDVNPLNDDEYILKNWRKWSPAPVEADNIGCSSRSNRQSDIVGILVNIYDRKDLFVEEYRRLLAQRILQNFECNVEHERRNLELLTLRFGESDLHSCEVMIQDISVSKRIDNRINAGEIEAFHWKKFPTKCLILSAQFWPEKLGLSTTEEGNNLHLPPPAKEAITTYTQAFETIKGSRTLNWLLHIGLVEIDLDFGSPELNQTFCVSPIHASIIWQFQEKTVWTLADLAQTLCISTPLLKRKIGFWIGKGIIRESGERFILNDLGKTQRNSLGNDSLMTASDNDDESDYEEDLNESASTPTQNQDPRERRMRMYWSFIENILRNLNPLPLERIRSMLNMFAFQASNETPLTIQQLKNFLAAQIREGKLVLNDGLYSLA